MTGMFMSIGTIAFAGLVVLSKLLFDYPQGVPGWTTLAIAFIGGVQLTVLGIIGEYVGQIFDAARGLPPYVVGETANLELEAFP